MSRMSMTNRSSAWSLAGPVALALAVLLGEPGAQGAQGAAPEAPPPDGTLVERVPVDLASLEVPEDLRPRLDQLATAARLERIVYASDGLLVDGYLLLPADPDGGPWPCVIFNRGGNRDFGGLNELRALSHAPLARAGYLVVMSDYRGNGPGLERYPPDRSCEECGDPVGGRGREEFGGAEVNDVLALIPLLEALPEADASRLGMYGWSRGGMMTYLALQRLAARPGGASRVRAAVIGAGMADSFATLAERPGMEHVYADLVPGWSLETMDAALEARSPVLHAEALPAETPLLLLHGSADRRVDPRQALDMTRALVEARRPVRLMLLEGGDHGLNEYGAEVDEAVVRWLDRYVRDGERWPSLEPHGR